MKLNRSFFERPTLTVARELLGCELIFGECAGIICETEAYVGQSDPACHAARGRTPRNRVMWDAPGHAYVYFTYGMYHCLNLVTEAAGNPCAVLIRAVTPTQGIEQMRKRRAQGSPFQKQKTVRQISDQNLCDGPAKLCQAFAIDRAQNGIDICSATGEMYVIGRESEPDFITTPRIGISAGTELSWRFVIVSPR